MFDITSEFKKKKKRFTAYSHNIKQAIGIQVIFNFEIKLHNYTF